MDKGLQDKSRSRGPFEAVKVFYARENGDWIYSNYGSNTCYSPESVDLLLGLW